ncbi:hypothetical protein KAFR_0A08560 [Kazachstania africana CBS 2517]|uniref:Protein KRE1 n=1 Tax=Kazachstania africana (strain ATCC 22294 / BCRC 22015 / CBS 2517 / CECT 1963 / NBRC 1671 / NRRL Y-8276) TaxID=1071382 RepID=H2APJ0_KAZAF|nr:hypothetical protein KAFR_0A08560 [Kazachstania africana CBS 2517]CCF56290.1 hypothetical protein KAFR_0A08560 [Kazachstania africana CBS 2517]
MKFTIAFLWTLLLRYTVASTTSSSTYDSVTSSSNGESSSLSWISRPDPSTAFTSLPKSAVTTLSIDSMYTITEGTTKTYTSSRSATSIWVTVVSAGVTITVQTTFAQRFSSQYTAVASPSSGSVGLGSISGSVGYVKSTLEYTITDGANGMRLLNSGSAVGLIAMFITLFI